MKMTLLVATNNAGKLRELRQIMAGLPIKLVGPSDLGIHLDVVENGTNFEQNAVIKARAYAEASGLPALADDSGLEVDALDGRPGIMSARYAGADASDEDRRQKLLQEMADVPPERRNARFRCVVALVWGGQVYTAEGTVEGRITTEERGSGGFGYDPIFLLPDQGKTMAELSPEEKNAISHRGKAARKMRALLQRLLANHR